MSNIVQLSSLAVALIGLVARAAPAPPPLYHGCISPAARALQYCNTTLSHEQRVADLISHLNVTEQIGQLSPTQKPFCAVHTPAIDRIGLPKYKWLTEVNSAVSNTGCASEGRCATQFIGPLGSAASFNRSSWWRKGDVVSTDMRAYNNLNTGETGLTGFGPNINTLKDPRYGRNSELAGEDPFLSGEYATAYTRGMQQLSSQGHLKMLSYLKHYTAYSVEASRFTFVANVTLFDLWDSYLPQYEIAFTQGQASGAMCSYFAPNGVSCCGNNYLLNEVIRGRWNRSDAVVMSDCSAVNNMQHNGYASGPEDASAKALNGGLDIYGGWDDDLWTQGYLLKAIEDNMTTANAVTAAVTRTFLQKFKVGMFDPVESDEWTQIGAEALNSSYAQQVSFEAALQGLVLLKNDGNLLPLSPGIHVAVVGPMANATTGLLSDYANTEIEPSPMESIAGALAAANLGGSTEVAVGVDVDSNRTSGIGAALELAGRADLVVLVLGITRDQEHEGIDRQDTLLPGNQQSFAEQVLSSAPAGKVVLVLCNGGILSVDTLIPKASAIIEAFSPAVMGPRAIAESLFGHHNRWGKLPVTVYPAEYSNQLQITDMSFTTPPGRSYRYYQATPLFRFGEGLSYTSFAVNCSCAPGPASIAVECTLANTGSREGDEVVQLYHRLSGPLRKQVIQLHPVPFRKLVGFERVTLDVGSTQDLGFSLPRSRLALTTNDGERKLYPGVHELVVARGREDDAVLKITIA
eukprot:TRINITY_DN11725_c0_g2_i2.p1 TRINITY_DN11725_c0_g2~~TRINITY_DN11725_c0_g2_i2.p1  ORF type:complete len:747 (-),score=170.82 TRINITY_DN11725_c0_g2_i2:277-2517(-)